MRWLDELLHPSRKCARVGHVMRDVEQDLYVLPDIEKDICWTRYVAVETTEITPTCARCGLKGEVREDEDMRRGLTSLTMPSDRWKILRKEGRLAQ